MIALARTSAAVFLLVLAALAGHLTRAQGEDPPAAGAVPSADVEKAFEVLKRAIGQKLVPSAVTAPAAADGQNKTTFSDEEVLTILRRVDPAAHIDRPTRLWFATHGQNILVSNEGTGGLQIIHIMQGIPGDIEVANRWNSGKRFTSCSIDADGDWWLELDIPTWGGISAAHVYECLDLFRSSLSAYLEELSALLPDEAPKDGPQDNR